MKPEEVLDGSSEPSESGIAGVEIVVSDVEVSDVEVGGFEVVVSGAGASDVSVGVFEVGVSVVVGDGGALDDEEVVGAGSDVLDDEVELDDDDGAGVELASEVDEAIEVGGGNGEDVDGGAGAGG